MENETATTVAQTAEFAPMMFAVYGAIFLFTLVSLWKVYAKAGHPGWHCLIPIYNMVVMQKIAQRPVWHLVMLFVPLVNIYFAFTTYHGISKAFGKGTGFTVGLFFFAPIFFGILAFGDNKYHTGTTPTPIRKAA